MICLVAVLVALAAAAPPQSSASEAELGAWETLFEMDLGREVLRRGRARVEGGDLAGNGRAVALVARALFDSGAEGEALRLLDDARVDAASRAFVLVERARIHLERDELQAVFDELAVPEGGRESVRYPGLADAWILLARARARAGDEARAAPLCRRFLELAPLHREAPTAWHLLAAAATGAGEIDEAQQCLAREAFLRRWHALVGARRLQIRRQPKEPLPRLGLALCWLEVERPEQARVELEELVVIAPDFCRGWFHLAEARRLTGDANGAVEAYARTLACDPEHVEARFDRALIQLLRGQLAAARADFEHLVASEAASEPRFAAAHLHLARILLRQGEPAAAQARYARYVALGGAEPLAP